MSENNDQFLGCIVGHILGDGSIDKKYLQPCYTNSNNQLLLEFYIAVKNIFGFEPRIWLQESNYGSSVWKKRLNSIEDCPAGHTISLFYKTELGRSLNTMFGNFAIGKSKTISEQIMNKSKKFKCAMIRAFFDDEGYVGVSSYTLRVYQNREDVLVSFLKY